MTTSVEKKVNGTPLASVEPRFEYDPVRTAEAEAIRTAAQAKADADRIEAEGKARAAAVLAGQQAEQLRLENEKTQLSNERNALRLRRERATEEAKIAEAEAKKEETERQKRTAREQEAAEKEAAEKQGAAQQKTADSWRIAAKTFYAVCQVVALPVQMHAFWNPHAPWLLAAPLVLEGGAWVVQRGTRAAVAERRPFWHYRLIAWCLAFLAAGINLGHGLSAFDLWTALTTAFCSVAGPGVDDLHEHGRMRVRDGRLTRRERRAQEQAAKDQAAEKAAAAERAEAERQAKATAAEEAAKTLAADREKRFPKVWEHALDLAAAMGETTVTEAVWKRAHRDIEGCDPGDSVDIIRTRNVNERRVAAARSEAPGNTPVKAASAQRAIQVKAPRSKSSYRPTPPRRTKGDTPKFHAAARALASDAKRASAAANGAAEGTSEPA